MNVKAVNWILVITIILLAISTIGGVMSISLENTYSVTNQYGEEVEMYGAGLYAHDSLFKAPIFIGTDCAFLLFIVPMIIVALIRNKGDVKSQVNIISVTGIVLYYAASMSFGVTYNFFHLLYSALFALSLYTFIVLLFGLQKQNISCKYNVNKGVNAFFIISGIAIYVAWLPDIMSSFIKGGTLSLIEVYTTEITYIIDMAVLSPLMFITAFLMKRRDILGFALAKALFRICGALGAVLPLQTVFQIYMGIDIPISALISKVLIFLVLACFAVYFDRKMTISVD